MLFFAILVGNRCRYGIFVCVHENVLLMQDLIDVWSHQKKKKRNMRHVIIINFYLSSLIIIDFYLTSAFSQFLSRLNLIHLASFSTLVIIRAFQFGSVSLLLKGPTLTAYRSVY